MSKLVARTVFAFAAAALAAGAPAPIDPREGVQAVEVLRELWPVADLPAGLAASG